MPVHTLAVVHMVAGHNLVVGRKAAVAAHNPVVHRVVAAVHIPVADRIVVVHSLVAGRRAVVAAHNPVVHTAAGHWVAVGRIAVVHTVDFGLGHKT